MLAPCLPWPVPPALPAGRPSLVASATRSALTDRSYVAFSSTCHKTPQEARQAIQAPPRHKDTTPARKRRLKRSQAAPRRSIAEDAGRMAEINRSDILERHRDRHRLTFEQKQNAARLLERAQGPTMAIKEWAPLLFSWRAE